MPRVQQAEARVAAQTAGGAQADATARAPKKSAQARAALRLRRRKLRTRAARSSACAASAIDRKGRAVSPQDLEAARAAPNERGAGVANAVARRSSLTLAGPRAEDIAQAQAQLDAAQADLAAEAPAVADAELDGADRWRDSRSLMEPGELATPQRPVFSLAITDPKWVRAYAVRSRSRPSAVGSAGAVTIDSCPGCTARRHGRLHFIDGGVHAEDGADRGIAHQPGLRSARVRRRPRGSTAARHAGDGADRPVRRRRRRTVSDAEESRWTPAEASAPLRGREICEAVCAREEAGDDARSTACRSTRRHGALTALVGPDGAGKTTLLRLAAGLMRADAGTLTVLGLDVAQRSAGDPGSHQLHAAALRPVRGPERAGEPRSLRRSARRERRRARASAIRD